MSNAVAQDPAREKPKKSIRARISKVSRSGWLSHQHGGWPMAIVPVFVGSYLGGFDLWQLLLLLSWVLAFQFFDAGALWIQAVVPRKRSSATKAPPRYPRGRKYLPPIITYALLAATGAGILVVTHPNLLWYGLGIAPLAAIAIYENWFGRPRSFLARASAIMASCLLAPMAFSLGTDPADWRYIWFATVVLVAYFIGTVPYVKTMIRERGNPWWVHFSLSYHISIAVLAVAGATTGIVSVWVAAVFLILSLRAWAFPFISKRRGKPLKPIVFGLSEFVFCALVVWALLVS